MEVDGYDLRNVEIMSTEMKVIETMNDPTLKKINSTRMDKVLVDLRS
jgi:hypothetical protein